MAAWFGPITTFWFGVLAAGGIVHIVAHSGILAAANTYYGASFLLSTA